MRLAYFTFDTYLFPADGGKYFDDPYEYSDFLLKHSFFNSFIFLSLPELVKMIESSF